MVSIGQGLVSRSSCARVLGVLIAVAVVLLAAAPAGAQQSRTRPTLAIIGIEATDAARAAAQREGVEGSLDLVMDSLDGRLLASISGTRKFSVVARSDLERLLDEQDLQQVFAADPARALNMVGAQYGVVFRIDGFRDAYVQRLTAEGDRVAQARRTVFVSVVATLYDIEAGTATESVTAEYADQPLNRDWGAMGAERAVVDDLMAGSLDAVASELAKDVTRSVLYRTFPARVALVENREVYLSWGDGTPIEPGQVWEIYDLTRVEDIDFPGEFMEIERMVGSVRIERVSPSNAAATVLENFGIERGAVARFVAGHEDDEPTAETRDPETRDPEAGVPEDSNG